MRKNTLETITQTGYIKNIKERVSNLTLNK